MLLASETFLPAAAIYIPELAMPLMVWPPLSVSADPEIDRGAVASSMSIAPEFCAEPSVREPPSDPENQPAMSPLPGSVSQAAASDRSVPVAALVRVAAMAGWQVTVMTAAARQCHGVQRAVTRLDFRNFGFMAVGLGG